MNAPGARPSQVQSGSQSANEIRERMGRPGGASARELVKATGWQPHSLRGFLSGKGEDGERIYSLKA
jgi:hypothetical protein